MFARRKIYPPNICCSSRNDLVCFSVSRKHLPSWHPRARCPTAVHRYGIRFPVLMAMIVTKLDTVRLSRQDPGTRTVITNNERDPDAVFFACSNMHHQRLVFEGRVVSRGRGDRSRERFAAKLLQFSPEDIDGRLRRARRLGRNHRRYTANDNKCEEYLNERAHVNSLGSRSVEPDLF